MTAWMVSTDELGPEKILHVYDTKTGMKGVVVVDTTMTGISGGGTRMMPDITTQEIADLARAMTHKFAIFGFPVGGAKAGIWADPGLQGEAREELLHAFGQRVKPLLEGGVTLAADIGTDGEDVAAFYEGAGLSSGSTGLALHEIEGEPLENYATGFGVVTAAKAACEAAGIDMKGASAAIEGFGKVGGGVARYLDEGGARVVAVSTLLGTIYNPRGLDVPTLLAMRREFGDSIVQQYKDARLLDRKEIYGLPVDILFPGARPYVIDKTNMDQVQARIISSIANIPITPEAETHLFQKKIFVVPDFISNAGGVMVAIVDLMGGTPENVFTAINHLIYPLTRDILLEAFEKGTHPRQLAVSKTTETVLAARENPAVLSFDDVLNKGKEILKL